MSLRTHGSSGGGIASKSNTSQRKIGILTWSGDGKFLGHGNASTLIRLLKGKTIVNVAAGTDMKSVLFYISDGTIMSFYEDHPGPMISCFQ